jgi:hypothetical protein
MAMRSIVQNYSCNQQAEPIPSAPFDTEDEVFNGFKV